MLTFTVVAIRLIGLWVMISRASDLLYLALASLGLLSITAPDDYWVAVIAMSLVMVLAGAALLLFARPIARLMVGKEAATRAPPDAVTERGFTQVGVFLIGIFYLIDVLPGLVAATAEEDGMGVPPDYWIQLTLALILIFGCGLFGGLVKQLRRWP